jgi:hypothetical protein
MLKARLGKILLFLLVVLVGLSVGVYAAASTNNFKDLFTAPAPHYPQNASGQTYGSLGDVTVPGTEPDLVKAMGVDGTVGYVRCSDIIDYSPITVEEAVAQQGEQVTKRIPLYKEDGKTVIGEFELGSGDGEIITADTPK